MNKSSLNLDHIYIVVSNNDYNILRSHEGFKNFFTAFYESKTETDSRSWSGLYGYFASNYIEIFSAEYMKYKLGQIGIGLSSVQFNDWKAYLQDMNVSIPEADFAIEEMKLQKENKNPHWFHSLKTKHIHPKCRIWSMFYHPEFLDLLKVSHDMGNFNREDYLKLKVHQDAKISHISKVELAIQKSEIEQFSRIFQLLVPTLKTANHCLIQMCEQNYTGFKSIELKTEHLDLLPNPIELETVKILQKNNTIRIEWKLSE